jgi:hypothetical protein
MNVEEWLGGKAHDKRKFDRTRDIVVAGRKVYLLSKEVSF